MTAGLIDSNVLLDVMTEDPQWASWSTAALERAANTSRLVINAIIYAEVSLCFSRIEDLEAALPRDVIDREPLPYEAAFLAGKAFLAYRRRGGAAEHNRCRCRIFSLLRMQQLPITAC